MDYSNLMLIIYWSFFLALQVFYFLGGFINLKVNKNNKEKKEKIINTLDCIYSKGWYLLTGILIAGFIYVIIY